MGTPGRLEDAIMTARATHCEGFAPDTPSMGNTIENGAQGRAKDPRGRRRRRGGVPTVVETLASAIARVTTACILFSGVREGGTHLAPPTGCVGGPWARVVGVVSVGSSWAPSRGGVFRGS